MGSGMEIIDAEYAAKKGINCISSPSGNANAVGEHTLGLLLSLTKNIGRGDRAIRSGQWRREENRGLELEGRTLGIIGYGHAGRAFARKLSGFDMRILAYDKYNPESIEAPVLKCNKIEDLQSEAEIISFHVPLREDTFHYFNENFSRAMARPFILINTSRGSVVDLDTLIQGLSSGKVMGACLDVFESEPPLFAGSMETLLKFDNVICTPHIAGYSYESIFKMSNVLLNAILKLEP